ncbi:MAG: hypothetical protein Q4G08_10050, partial [Capnocytophaga sp.]|nr:hypothetical protein [Capnocytophaga sp.]
MKKLLFSLAAMAIVIVGCSKDGSQGEKGEQGTQGVQGVQGIPGKDGAVIYSGDGAPNTTLGAEGDMYLDKTSSNLYGPKASTGWGTPLGLQGATGATGAT